jgi:hypothetical protein
VCLARFLNPDVEVFLSATCCEPAAVRFRGRQLGKQDERTSINGGAIDYSLTQNQVDVCAARVRLDASIDVTDLMSQYTLVAETALVLSCSGLIGCNRHYNLWFRLWRSAGPEVLGLRGASSPNDRCPIAHAIHDLGVAIQQASSSPVRAILFKVLPR